MGPTRITRRPQNLHGGGRRGCMSVEFVQVEAANQHDMEGKVSMLDGTADLAARSATEHSRLQVELETMYPKVRVPQ